MAALSSNKLADLEAQVKSLIVHLHELKGRNARLEERLREVDGRVTSQNSTLRQWEKERDWLRAKLSGVLGELENIESSEPSLRD